MKPIDNEVLLDMLNDKSVPASYRRAFRELLMWRENFQELSDAFDNFSATEDIMMAWSATENVMRAMRAWIKCKDLLPGVK